MATSFGEDTNAATFMQLLEDGRVDFTLINMRGNLELCAFEALSQCGVGLFILDILAGQLTQGNITAEGLLDTNLVGPQDLLDLGIRKLVVESRQCKHSSNHVDLVVLKVRVNASDQGGVILRIGQVYCSLSRLLQVQGTANWHRANHSCTPTNEFPPHRLFGDQERDSAEGIGAQDTHEDQGVDELVGVRSGNDDDGAIARDLPRTARVNFAEEEVDEDGEGP